EIAEVLSREGMSVGPFVPGSDAQGENSAVADLHVLQDVGNEVQVLVVADKPGVSIDDDHANIFRISHEHPELTAVAARLAPHALEIDDARLVWDPGGYRRQIAGLDGLLEIRRLDHRLAECGE